MSSVSRAPVAQTYAQLSSKLHPMEHPNLSTSSIASFADHWNKHGKSANESDRATQEHSQAERNLAQVHDRLFDNIRVNVHRIITTVLGPNFIFQTRRNVPSVTINPTYRLEHMVSHFDEATLAIQKQRAISKEDADLLKLQQSAQRYAEKKGDTLLPPMATAQKRLFDFYKKPEHPAS